MEQDPVVLAIGVDFQRVEAALVDTAGGGVIHREQAPVRPVISAGTAYLEPAHLVGAVSQAARRLVELKPREARRVAGVSLIGRSHTACLVTREGARTPFVLSEDSRFAAARDAAGIPYDEVYSKTGLTRERCEVPFALAAAGSPRAAAKLLTPKDYVKWALTGEFSTDPLDAQRTFVWDLAARQWDKELCRIFDIRMSCLPDVLPPTAEAGTITADGARITGLKQGLPVACGMGDWGEYLGSGAHVAGDAFEHIGSTGAFFAVTGRRPADRLGLDARPHVTEGLYLVGRQGLPGGACLEWLLRKTSFTRDGEIDWAQVEQELEAAAAMLRPEGILFFPNLTGGEGQVSNGAFMNLRMDDDLTGFIQAIVEGLFFTLKAVSEKVKPAGWLPKAVFTTGQIAFKHAPRRIRANIYGVPIYAGRTPGANVMAAALVGAVASGVYASIDQARARMLSLDGGALPDRATQALYEAHFASWLGTRNFLAPDAHA